MSLEMTSSPKGTYGVLLSFSICNFFGILLNEKRAYPSVVIVTLLLLLSGLPKAVTQCLLES